MQLPVNDPLPPTGERDAHHAALLAASARGDARAFETFYRATARHALSVARRVCGDAYAQDVTADAYFQAWRSAGEFDAGRGSALTWLLTIARSRALDRVRQESVRHGGMQGAPAFDADEQQQAQQPGPDALLESVETSSRLHAALARLSANERWVLGLAYFREHTQAEIAGVTGLPLGTVKSLMTRAQHKLRTALCAEIPQ